jgi:hypothetical protein
MEEEIDSICPAGKLEAFQKAYHDYFSDYKELIKAARERHEQFFTELWELPENTSLRDASNIAGSLIKRAICYEPTKIGFPICVYTVAQKDGIKLATIITAE